mmetsp:Transcript_12996/g.38682  ORF Transcript_12996/g.38682 Transcript_12996/m.38682 type:complete len:283 (+) Transcript_12996:2564-3412(+)
MHILLTKGKAHYEVDDNTYLLAVVLSLMVFCWGLLVRINVSRRGPGGVLSGWGVPLRRIKRALEEIDRKAFHLCGLLVPLTHLGLLRYGWSQADCVELVWTITAAGWASDLLRLRVPFVARNWPLRSIMREHEKDQLTGGCYFSLGCALAMTLAPPAVSICAMVYLVLGDMAAALVGVSFGGEVAHVKLGRKGKKSVEGSLAMFCVCFVVGQLTFADLKLSEYVAFCGAVIATLTELYEPFHLNDNLTIPVFSALALQLSLGRVREKDCYQPEPCPPPCYLF